MFKSYLKSDDNDESEFDQDYYQFSNDGDCENSNDISEEEYEQEINDYFDEERLDELEKLIGN